MYKLAVVGSREFTDYNFLKNLLEPRLDEISMIVSGGAIGTDTLAQQFAKECGLPILIYYPDWKKFGKFAGFRRNFLITETAEKMIAVGYQDSKGTRHSVNQMIKLGKPYIFIVFSGNGFGIETNLDHW